MDFCIKTLGMLTAYTINCPVFRSADYEYVIKLHPNDGIFLQQGPAILEAIISANTGEHSDSNYSLHMVCIENGPA